MIAEYLSMARTTFFVVAVLVLCAAPMMPAASAQGALSSARRSCVGSLGVYWFRYLALLLRDDLMIHAITARVPVLNASTT